MAVAALGKDCEVANCLLRGVMVERVGKEGWREIDLQRRHLQTSSSPWSLNSTCLLIKHSLNIIIKQLLITLCTNSLRSH